MVARALSIAAADASCSLTSNPDCANTWAMPLPMVPAPITPTDLIKTRAPVDVGLLAFGFGSPEAESPKPKARSRLENFYRQRDTIPAAETQRCDAALLSAPAQRVDQRRQH